MPTPNKTSELEFQSQNESKNTSEAGQNRSRKSTRGLASADPETRRQVARKGGQAVSQNRAHMAEIGKKGGEAVSRDRKHMAEIGRKGGEVSQSHRGNSGESRSNPRSSPAQDEDFFEDQRS